MSEKTLERLFGRDFVEKYRKAKAKAQQIPARRLEQIKQFAIENMATATDYHLKYNNLDVLLVEAPLNKEYCEVKKTSAGNYRVTAIWYGCESLRGPYISVFCGLEETAKQIVRSTGAPSLLVGKLREETYEGDTTYSFRCLGVIPLDEDSNVIDAGENTEQENEEVETEEWDMSNIMR